MCRHNTKGSNECYLSRIASLHCKGHIYTIECQAMFALYLLCSSKLHVMRNTTLQCSGRIIVNSCKRNAACTGSGGMMVKVLWICLCILFFFFKPIGMASFRELLVWFPLRKDGVMMIQSVLTKL